MYVYRGWLKIWKTALRQKDKGTVIFPQIQKNQKWIWKTSSCGFVSILHGEVPLLCFIEFPDQVRQTAGKRRIGRGSYQAHHKAF